MNKTLKIILAASLIANAVWLFGSFGGWFSNSRQSVSGADNKIKSGSAISALSPEAANEITDLLATTDLTALRDRLRALKLPDSVVRSIVRTRIWDNYTVLRSELFNKAAMTAQQRPYWKSTQAGGMFLMPGMTREQQMELTKMGQESRDLERKLLGVDTSYAGYNQLRYGFLGSEKASRLDDIESDYRDLRQSTYQEMQGFRMPGDAEKLKVLDDEMKRDMETLLTPEEREANKLRNSDTARSLIRNLGAFDLTEDEYKTIFALQNAMDEKYSVDYMAMSAGGINPSSDFYRARSDAQKEVETQIKDVLGADRYEQYLASQRQDYRSLQAAAQRFNLTPETVSQTYQVRNSAVTEAKRISDDKTLSTAQKTEAYASLAEQATAQIRSQLGEEIGDAYINNSLSWLKNLPNGGTVNVSPRGDVFVAPPRPPRPAPPGR